MSSYTQPIMLKTDPSNPKIMYLAESYVWYLDWSESSDYVGVDKGFGSDGMSIPNKLWYIFRKFDGRTIKASVAHDYLYKHRKIHTMSGHTYNCERKQADEIFYAMLIIGGKQWIEKTSKLQSYRRFMWRIRCKLAYYALRLFGWAAWYMHRMRG